jgi:hypothetical protein
MQAANAIDTTCEWMDVSAKWPKFLGTTPVNMALVRMKQNDIAVVKTQVVTQCCLCAYAVLQVIRKDIAFAHMFSSRPPSAMPLPSYALFAIRDAHTVAASFLLPPMLANKLLEGQYLGQKSHAEVRVCVKV